MSQRVKLITAVHPEILPLGSEGTVVTGVMHSPGMLRILWDNGMEIPMYRNELIVIHPNNRS